ncbi:MAG TPA: thiamine pyrophosphate-binding protein [Gaiella sp.]|nr:thiamine pyrophosphate-binding protein [Gaiella sp.]
MTRTGGRILVDQLALHGSDLAFGVPGESYVDVLDALRDSPVRYVTCRHEAGAANMAEAYGKLTGRPGICLVTRGPGATQASVGVHTAFQDGTPLLLLVGQIRRGDAEREAFQEIDYRRMFGPLAKWVAEIDRPDRIPELVARAFRTATSGRPGPVVLALPEDMLAERADVADASPYAPAQAGPTPADSARVREVLAAAERPLVVVGGLPWSGDAGAALAAWCTASGIPVAAAWRCQDYVDNDAACYAGHLGLGADATLRDRLRDADVLLVVGARLGDIETAGYTTIVPPGTGRTLVHVHPDPDELGRVYEPAVGVVSSGAAFAAALAALEPLDGAVRAASLRAAHDAYRATLSGRDLPGEIDLTRVMGMLRERLPEDAILASGAGNFTVWAHRFYVFRRYGTQLAPVSGAMGYGLPASIAAKLLHPERIVVCVAGDGDLLMSAGELATARQAGAHVVVLVVDNGMYGTIRMHQERRFPGRVSGTDLENPDFAALARSFGWHAERVERTDDVPAALDRALGADAPALLHLPVDPEALTPRQTLSEIRAEAEARRPRPS